ncbi:uncharacterized protein LOC142982747 [Anticarsia gemmatalis]|uniref:uncharacterized protein LOC142982747 n=1 Tax=Anticarsia gemmatalis TaxID=129554 RepID=UPI003F7710B2
MSCYLILLLCWSLSMNTLQVASHISEIYRKYVNQKDMSEYCHRHVAPSIFISRQITEANSQVLYFAGRERPYSCFINVRTEIGSNIIVVIQVLNNKDLKETCKNNDNQLVVYEIGETFGSYWGQMPRSVMSYRKRRRDRSYTLKRRTTTVPTESTTTSPTTVSTTTTTSTETPRTKTTDPREYITVLLPLLNVSAIVVPGIFDEQSSFTTENNFDLLYDVVPRPGTSYDTKTVQLVEFAMKKITDGRRNDNDTEEYSDEVEVRFNDLFTPDPRLTFPPFNTSVNRRKSNKPYPNINRLTHFKKNKRLFSAKQKLTNKRPTTYRRPQLHTLLPSDLSKHLQSTHDSHHINVEKPHSWNVIHDILKNLSDTKDGPTQPPHQELANFLRGVSDTGFNKSVYLATNVRPVMSSTKDDVLGSLTSQTTIETTREQASSSTIYNTLNHTSQDSNKLFNKSDVQSSNDSALNHAGDESIALLPLLPDVDNIIKNVTNENKNKSQETFTTRLETKATTTKNVSQDPLTVSLVDHESWENVVNAAPVMADILNHTKLDAQEKPQGNVTRGRRRVRRKRFMHAIGIDNARPHRMTRPRPVSTTLATDDIGINEFQQLLELQDDEIHDRVSMKYVRQYLGPPLFNLCNVGENFTNHVYLFNSSRLVFSLYNFSMNRMMIVLTPAHTLQECETRCAPGHLECQVSGARVCIDSLSACDGVPNCGSFDIYDEDRLRCGAAFGTKENTVLAAITFLATLLTVLYAVHYWLKRCVPKVSDAFFIYTDAAENVLFLDSIMRSPHDMGNGKTHREYREAMLDYMECEDIASKDNACKRFMKRCATMFRGKRGKSLPEDEALDDINNLYSKKMTTFAEMEISKMGSYAPFPPFTADVAVQTSLELEAFPLSDTDKKDEYFGRDRMTSSFFDFDTLTDVDIDLNRPSDELNILKFLRTIRQRSVSKQVSSDEMIDMSLMSATKSLKEEKEIQCLEYNPDHYSVDDNSDLMESIEKEVIAEVHTNPPVEKACKHLRFQEDVTFIPTTSDDDENDDDIVDHAPIYSNRRSIVFGATKVTHLQPQASHLLHDVEEPGPSSGREFKSYFNWGGGKDKKKKKPKKK